ncbi:molybdate ABC transporter substrate-binding protein [Palleronia pelagia]|uniref:Molybdate transport system substrate-binding protein n=1 Tax=Palleronia pelagia TaxID=387096 RepID=A0A1H8BMX2_9RHOB|nr:molybdate ABC transporter substrate-binding protein [Palleronia pelagia]SEM84205.1 molybdate transport system substrate-binding protein [Palleronia pelagia]
MARFFLIIWLLAQPVTALADTVRLAVAANALPAAEALARAFTDETGEAVSIAHGATGKLYVQITRGAPFDIFLSADSARPERLMREGLGRASKPYALGRLVLVAPEGIDAHGAPADLLRGQRIALADPALAPYGAAAVETLDAWGLGLDGVQPLLAENVGQVAVWLSTGNADYGLLAASLLPDLQTRRDVTAIPVATDLHAPIAQDAVWLASAADTPVAARFWAWLDSETADAILADHGYDVPAR